MSNILVVDDNELSLLHLSTLLNAAGFTTTCARNGREALSAAKSVLPDAVVSDLLMPVMDGYKLLRAWRSDPSLFAIPFVVYSASFNLPEDQSLAFNLGASAFIPKPQEPAAFLHRLQAVLNSSGRQSEPRELAPAADDSHPTDHADASTGNLQQKCIQLEQANLHLRDELRHRTALAATQSAIVDSLAAELALVDAGGVVLEVNRAWLESGRANGFAESPFGIGSNYLEICDYAAAKGSLPASQIAEAIRKVLQRQATSSMVEYRSPSVNQPAWFQMNVTPFQAQQAAGAVVMHTDITQQKLSEIALKRSVTEKQALLQEIHHRVKNNLSIISSLLGLQAHALDNQEAKSKLQDAERRVMSMSMIHDHMYKHDDMRSINLAEYARQLAAHIFDSCSLSSLVTYRLEAVATPLPIEKAIPCGLILNELITNSLKYAYPGGQGEILVRIGAVEDSVLMGVSDLGVGLPPNFDPAGTNTLGMKIIDALTSQIEGSLEIGTRPGCSFTITFPKPLLAQAAVGK